MDKGTTIEGYKVVIASYKDDRVDRLVGQVLICAISLRFAKKTPAHAEVASFRPLLCSQFAHKLPAFS